MPSRITDCIVAEFAKASDEKIKSAFLSGDEVELVDLFAECVPGAS